VKQIETDRLVLRRFTLDDLEAAAAFNADPEVMRFVFRSRTTDETRRGIEYFHEVEYKYGFSLMATVYKPENCVIGQCGLMPQIIGGVAEVEIGYILAKSYWGRGLATEAAVAQRDYGFREFGLRRLVSIIRPDNLRSQQVAEKVGMQHERDFVHGDGHLCRLYSLSHT
jgi:ribosomal-protein-alanine N-acetyltransferase